jgi:hypothetical protein
MGGGMEVEADEVAAVATEAAEEAEEAVGVEEAVASGVLETQPSKEESPG